MCHYNLNGWAKNSPFSSWTPRATRGLVAGRMWPAGRALWTTALEEMSVDEMSVDELSVGELSVGELSVGELSWDPSLFEEQLFFYIVQVITSISDIPS